MIRVLQVLGRTDHGGAESMIMNLYRHIDREQVQFDFVTHTTDRCFYDDEIESLGGRIYHVPRFSGKNLLSYRKAWKNLFATHKEWSIVHSHIRSTASIFLPIVHKYGLYTIAHSHSTSSGKDKTSFVKDILQKPLRHCADYYMACSNEAGRWLFGDKICDGPNYSILKNAIDTSLFEFNQVIRDKVRNQLDLSNKFVVGHVGRMETPKNHKFLLEIFAEVLKLRDNAILLLVGGGSLFEEIQHKAKELGIYDKIIFLGDRDDVSSLLQAMDVFVLPSLYEGLGIVAIEAQASALKCVISDTLPEESVVDSKLVEMISLNERAKTWAKKVCCAPYSRTSDLSSINKSGYNVVDTSKWLQDFYLIHDYLKG